EEIPLGARIFAVADALDAMTSDRPYRDALGWEDAADRIARESGRQFDPRVVSAFEECKRELRSAHEELVARWARQPGASPAHGVRLGLSVSSRRSRVLRWYSSLPPMR